MFVIVRGLQITVRQCSLTMSGYTHSEKKGDTILWMIFVILLVLWLIGLVNFHAIGAYIHILLVIALVVPLIQLFSGRRPIV